MAKLLSCCGPTPGFQGPDHQRRGAELSRAGGPFHFGTRRAGGRGGGKHTCPGVGRSTWPVPSSARMARRGAVALGPRAKNAGIRQLGLSAPQATNMVHAFTNKKRFPYCPGRGPGGQTGIGPGTFFPWGSPPAGSSFAGEHQPHRGLRRARPKPWRQQNHRRGPSGGAIRSRAHVG